MSIGLRKHEPKLAALRSGAAKRQRRRYTARVVRFPSAHEGRMRGVILVANALVGVLLAGVGWMEHDWWTLAAAGGPLIAVLAIAAGMHRTE